MTDSGRPPDPRDSGRTRADRIRESAEAAIALTSDSQIRREAWLRLGYQRKFGAMAAVSSVEPSSATMTSCGSPSSRVTAFTGSMYGREGSARYGRGNEGASDAVLPIATVA